MLGAGADGSVVGGRFVGVHGRAVRSPAVAPSVRGRPTAGGQRLVIGTIGPCLDAAHELLLAVIFMPDPDRLPIATAYLSFSHGFTQQFELLSPAGVTMVLPVLALFLLCQRRFTAGLAGYGLEG